MTDNERTERERVALELVNHERMVEHNLPPIEWCELTEKDQRKYLARSASAIAALRHAPADGLAEMRDLILAGKADHYAEPFARHREQARREALEEAEREVEQWFPCGTIDKPEFGAGKALREAIRKLKGD